MADKRKQAELFRALGSLVEPPTAESRQLSALLGLGEPPEPSAQIDLFLLQLAPYASIYLGAEGMLGGEARDRIAGFWRALGQTPPAEPDHLAVMLALYARLSELASGAADGRGRRAWGLARRTYLGEHLLSWLPLYLAKVERIGPPFYRRWARLLAEVLAEEGQGAAGGGRLPLHLRQAPSLSDPRREGADAFLDSLLAPVRSGLIVARSDLATAARELGLGMRIGERRFVLRALMQQDALAVLAWLEAEAAARCEERLPAMPEPIAAFWRGRAGASAELLATLRRDL